MIFTKYTRKIIFIDPMSCIHLKNHLRHAKELKSSTVHVQSTIHLLMQERIARIPIRRMYLQFCSGMLLDRPVKDDRRFDKFSPEHVEERLLIR